MNKNRYPIVDFSVERIPQEGDAQQEVRVSAFFTLPTDEGTDMAALVNTFAAMCLGKVSPTDLHEAVMSLRGKPPVHHPADTSDDADADHAPAEAATEVAKPRRGRPPKSLGAVAPATTEPKIESISGTAYPVKGEEPEAPAEEASPLPPAVAEKTATLIDLKAKIAAIETTSSAASAHTADADEGDVVLSAVLQSNDGKDPTLRTVLTCLLLNKNMPTHNNPDKTKQWCLEFHDRVPCLASQPDLSSRLDRAIGLIAGSAPH